MNLDIQIEGANIPDHLKSKFLEEFFSRLTQLNETSSDIDDQVCSTLATVLTEKPTDLLSGYKRVSACDLDKTCSICCEDFKLNEYKRTLRCNHIFHKKCIDKWFNSFKKVNCPTCRSNAFATVHQQASSRTRRQ